MREQMDQEEIRYETTAAWVEAAHGLHRAGEEIWLHDCELRQMFGFDAGGTHHLIKISTIQATPLEPDKQALIHHTITRWKLLTESGSRPT